VSNPSDRPTTIPDPPGAEVHLGVLLFRGVEPLDAVGPAQTFWVLDAVRPFVAPFAPVRVHLIAEAAGPVTMGYGAVLHATTSYGDCPQLDALVVPGGTGGEDDAVSARSGRYFYERDEDTIAFVARQAAGATVAASVCTGAFLLAAAGLLAGRRGTTHWLARDELVARMAERGEDFTLEIARVVDDGPVLTGGGVSSGIDLGLHVVGRLFGKDLRDAAALAIEVDTPGAA
jgi:cyclohexyl-isocyanide hydratase